MSLRRHIKGFVTNEQGAELAEYAVGVALLVAIGVVVYSTLGVAINDENTGTGAKIVEASDKTFPF